MEGWEPDAVAIIEWVFETTLRIIVYAFGSLPLKRQGIELSVPDKDYVIGGIRNFKFRPFRMGFFCFIMLYIKKWVAPQVTLPHCVGKVTIFMQIFK